MSLSETELAQPVSTRYAVTVLGGDAVFLVDTLLGHRIYMGGDNRLSKPELRRYVSDLDSDLHMLSTIEFFHKYGLRV